MPEGYDVVPATSPKKVLIAGGGPAGLECAHIAAARGHDVTICEKGKNWGGLTSTAIAIKGTHEKIQDHIDWLVHECEKQGVTMNLETEITAGYVSEQAPDVLISAIGGVKPTLGITGSDSNMVVDGYIADGQKVVVVGGIECEGVQVAIYLAKQGKQVTIIDELPEDSFGWTMPDWIGPQQKYYCQTHNIEVLAGVKYGTIANGTITVTLAHDDIEKVIECDDIVNALPLLPNTSLLDVVGNSVGETYAIGDSNAHGLIREAVLAGNLLGRKL
jgi:NADPH-dependent 2,4-dienoyl-CoA reductase/sulfur reductase-like enzyme